MKTLISTQSRFISYIIQCTLALLLSTSAQAQNIGINTLTADASSILDITHTTRGLLIPRIPLTSANDITTIVMPALSLLIFNTATAGIIPNNVKPGYYYFNGTKWVGIGTGVAWDLMGNLGTTAGTNFIGTIDAQDLVFKTNSLENMRILNSNGNVGIGTNSPLVNLDVLSSGNTNINVTSDGNFSILSATSYSTIGSPYFIGLLAQGTKLTPTYPTTGKILTYFAGRDAIDGRLGSAYGGGQIRIVTDENFTSVDKGTFMDFSTTQRGTNLPIERVTITSNGNVGIGTAFPANLLSNIPASSTYANVSSENTGQQAGKSLSWYNDISGFSAAFINTGILNGSNGVQIRTAGNSASQKILALGTGVSSIPNANTEIMTVLGNGNVGIGTTTPATKLHLLDGQITQEFTTNLSHSILMKNPSGRNWQLYHLSPTDGSAPNGFMFEHFDGTAWQRYMTLTQTGNVGIGTATPNEKLDIVGSIKIVDGTQGVGKVLTSDATGKGSWQNPSALANYPYQNIGPLPIGANCPSGGSYSTGTITLPAGIYNFIHYSCDGQLNALNNGHNVDIIIVTGVGDATSTFHNFINGSSGSCGNYFTGVLRCYTACTVRKTYGSYSGSSFNVPGANAENTTFIKIL